MKNFTPGPYRDNGDGFIRQAEQNEGSRLFIAQVIDIPFNFGGNKVTEANINLLKAAPDMYAALEFAKEVIDDQVARFHADCRCQLCESLPQLIAAALTKAGRA